jgi:hypothetical protein
MPNIAKRLKNLWKLSAYEPNEETNGTVSLPAGTKVVQEIVQKLAMAQIIRRTTPAQRALKEDE